MATYTVRVVFHASADRRSGNARPRLSSSLCGLRVLRGAHCDWIASLLNATGTIHHESFNGPSKAGNLAPMIYSKGRITTQTYRGRTMQTTVVTFHHDLMTTSTVAEWLQSAMV